MDPARRISRRDGAQAVVPPRPASRASGRSRNRRGCSCPSCRSLRCSVFWRCLRSRSWSLPFPAPRPQLKPPQPAQKGARSCGQGLVPGSAEGLPSLAAPRSLRGKLAGRKDKPMVAGLTVVWRCSPRPRCGAPRRGRQQRRPQPRRSRAGRGAGCRNRPRQRQDRHLHRAPQGYRLDPDVMDAKRETHSGGRPVRPGGKVVPDCATGVGPRPCSVGGINLIGVALTAAEMAKRVAKGQEVGSMFQTDPNPSEYQLYLMAKARREPRRRKRPPPKPGPKRLPGRSSEGTGGGSAGVGPVTRLDRADGSAMPSASRPPHPVGLAGILAPSAPAPSAGRRGPAGRATSRCSCPAPSCGCCPGRNSPSQARQI